MSSPRSDVEEVAPAPFVKWVGGKRQILPDIMPRVPRRVRTYYEPFVGGGAVFFALAGEERFQHAVIGDANEDLADTYRVIQQDVGKLVARLRAHERAHGEEHYYRVRDEAPASRVDRAARFIYLNKAGFNGLYRVNASGRFNVPFGRNHSPGICQEERLRAVSRVLSTLPVEIRSGDFEATVGPARPGDFVYFDPPYAPVSRTANFNSYKDVGFPDDQQARLAELLRCLDHAGVAALASNSDCDLTRALYDGLRIERVYANRLVNSRVSGRGPVPEILVSAGPSASGAAGLARTLHAGTAARRAP